jgi:hypothetical protein
MDRPMTAEREGGQVRLIDLEQSEIGIFVDADQVRLDDALFADRWQAVGRVNGGQGEGYVDDLRSLDHVSVGHNVSVGIDDYSGADRVLASYKGGLTAIIFLQRAIAGDQNLNHGGGNSGSELLDRGVELLQHGWGFGGTSAEGPRFIAIGLGCFGICDGWWWRRLLSKCRRRETERAPCDEKNKGDAGFSLRRSFRSAISEEHSETLLGHTALSDTTQTYDRAVVK